MTLSDVIGAMRAAGCSEAQIGSAMVKLTEAPRKLNAERQAKFRARNAERNALQSRVTVTSETPENARVPRARVEDNLLLEKIYGKEEREEYRPSKPSARNALIEGGLRSEIADAVVEHRVKLRKPLTPHAAELLAKAFNSTADPNAAADMMIARGWQGFNPDWAKETNGYGRNGKSVHEAVRSLGAHVAAGGTLDELFDLDCPGGRKESPRLLSAGGSGGTGDLRVIGSPGFVKISGPDRSQGH